MERRGIAVSDLRSQAQKNDSLLLERLETIVPNLMAREGIDAWVLIAREYNEDPVLATMLPATWLSARRLTILAFTHGGRTRTAIARYAVGDAFPGAWDPERQPDQWQALADHLAAAAPTAIAISHSPTFAHADGLSLTDYRSLTAALPDGLRSRLVSGERLAVGWLETRLPSEIGEYRRTAQIAHDLLGCGFASVTPGVTTTEDLEWWLRDAVQTIALDVWFHPTASVQRGGGTPRHSPADPNQGVVIDPGDLVHVDFGIVHHNLHTDQQQHAYVLQPGETEAPAGLRAALGIGNGLQDLLIAEFATGRTGNDILHAARRAAVGAGIRPTIYSHPIGLHGHGAGPTIGLWDQQHGVPGAGDYPVHPNTAYSIELSAQVDVPEWDDQTVSIMLEEDAFFDGNTIDWLDGRQTELHLIG